MNISKKISYPLFIISGLTIGTYGLNKERIDKFLNTTKGEIAKIIEAEASQYEQDSNLMKTCVLTESFKETDNLFQLEATTYKELAKELFKAGVKVDTTANGRFKLEDNIKCGVKHFSRLLYKYSDEYGRDYKTCYPEIEKIIKEYGLENLNTPSVLAIISYNRGEGNTEKWIKAGCKYAELPEVTKEYLKRSSRNLCFIELVD